MELRPYQKKLKHDIYNSLRSGKTKVCAQLPTGGGKTVIMGSIVHDAVANRRRVCIVAHRNFLLEQAAQKFRSVGVDVEIISGGRRRHVDYDPYGICQVVSVQSSHKIEAPPDLLLIDEAHHATASTYQSSIEKTIDNGGKVIGFTATPIRTSGIGLDDIFQDLVLGPSPAELIADGWIVPTANSTYGVRLKKGTLDNVKTTAGEYNSRELEEVMAEAVLFGDLIQAYRDFADGKKMITFATSVALSKKYAAMYTDSGIPAEHIDGTTSSEERFEIIERFKAGKTMVLTNCAIVTEGFDVPDTEAVQIVRPTQSVGLYLQMCGRCMRPALGKDKAIIIDHADNALRFGFAEMDREWSLSMKKRRGKIGEVFVGEEIISESVARVRKEQVHADTYRLTQLRLQDIEQAKQDQIHKDEYPELLTLVNYVEANRIRTSKGKIDYKWAWEQYKAIATPTLPAAKWLARRAGYHWRWAELAVNGYKKKWG